MTNILVGLGVVVLALILVVGFAWVMTTVIGQIIGFTLSVVIVLGAIIFLLHATGEQVRALWRER